MPRINSFVICSSFDSTNNGKGEHLVRLNSPLALVSPPCKGTYSFCVSLGITDFDYYIAHKIRCEICSPDKEVIFKTPESSTPVLDPNKIEFHLPEKYRGFVINIDLRNVMFKKSGIHIFNVYVDETKISSQQIPVWIVNEEDENEK